MEQIIKQAKIVGNSAGVTFPRKWLNKKVVVTLLEPSPNAILKDIIDILAEKNILKDVRGIYLIGSYARGETDELSDIDILVITSRTTINIENSIYSLILISEEKLNQSLRKDMIYYYPALKEAKTLMNSELIEKYKELKLNRESVLSYVASTRKMIKKIEDLIETDKKLGDTIGDATGYSLVLRLRGIYILNSLIRSKSWSKKGFKRLVNDSLYQGYLRVKNNKTLNNKIHIKDAEKIILEIKSSLNRLEKWGKENTRKKQGKRD